MQIMNTIIERVNNGWILHFGDPDTGKPAKAVFQVDDNTLGDERLASLIAMQTMIWHILDIQDVRYSKHEKHNLVIDIKANSE